MAVANLVIITVYMPRLIPMFLIGAVWLVEGDLGYALCKMVSFLHHVAIIASVLTLLNWGLDTFFAVVFPLKNLFTTKVAGLGTGANCHGGWHAPLIAHKLWRFRNTEEFYLYWCSIELLSY